MVDSRCFVHVHDCLVEGFVPAFLSRIWNSNPDNNSSVACIDHIAVICDLKNQLEFYPFGIKDIKKKSNDHWPLSPSARLFGCTQTLGRVLFLLKYNSCCLDDEEKCDVRADRLNPLDAVAGAYPPT